ncbi:MAG: hypothetical protein NTZ95_00905 [Candidatus Omnitrophica bacterium]|nr:hypothetical protein [Candidatus Omnitrophota bacterium]
MGTKKLTVIYLTVISLCGLFCVYFAYAQANSQNPVSTLGADKGVYTGMPKNDLLKIYSLSHVKKYERRANEEVLVFDDIVTSNPDDTVTFYLVDGKIKSWDKNKVSFPTDKTAQSAIYIGMPKEDLYKIYNPGNIKKYKKEDGEEVLIFDDILTSGPDDTVTFYLINGKVAAWDKNKVTITPEERLKAVEERSRYTVHSQDGASYEYGDMKAKEQGRLNRINSERSGWYYNRGLYYR